MYPVLIVDGKQLQVTDISYRDKGQINSVGVFEGHNYITYYDVDANVYHEGKLKLDMKTALKWVDRYEEVLDEITKVIDSKAEELTDLAIEAIETEQPFIPSEARKHYFNKQREMIGLIHAQEIIENLID